jgi:hypothetical protein
VVARWGGGPSHSPLAAARCSRPDHSPHSHHLKTDSSRAPIPPIRRISPRSPSIVGAGLPPISANVRRMAAGPPPWGGVGQPLIETLLCALMGLAPALGGQPNRPRQVHTTVQQASTLVIGTYSHTITLLIQTYSFSIFQIDLPLRLFNQLFERFERRKRHNFQYTTIKPELA